MAKAKKEVVLTNINNITLIGVQGFFTLSLRALKSNEPQCPAAIRGPSTSVLVISIAHASLTASVLSPTLDAMSPSMVPYSASRAVRRSIWLRWIRRKIKMATVERIMRTITGATITMASVVTL